MARILVRSLAALILVAVLALALLAVAARFSDGPLGPFAGGPLVAGELVPPPDDWSFLREVETVELQLLEPPRSRTTWIAVSGGRAYVPAGFMTVPLWKQWPHQAVADGRALLRVGGKRYPVRLVRVEDPGERDRVVRAVMEKYGPGDDPGPESLWIFRVEPRRAGTGGERTSPPDPGVPRP